MSATHFRALANLWGLKALLAGKADRSRRWFAVADRYTSES